MTSPAIDVTIAMSAATPTMSAAPLITGPGSVLDYSGGKDLWQLGVQLCFFSKNTMDNYEYNSVTGKGYNDLDLEGIFDLNYVNSQTQLSDGARGAKSDGNTNITLTGKQRVSPAKNWCFTLNSYYRFQWFQWIEKLLGMASKLVVQEEFGSGTLHLQGFVSFPDKVRPSGAISEGMPIHWEVCRNPKAAIEYCRDATKRCTQGRVWVTGVARALDLHVPEALRPWQWKIYESCLHTPDKYHRKIRWYWESNGNVGKSILAKTLVDTMECLVVSGKGSDVLYAVAEWVKKKGGGPDVIVWDVPRSCMDYVSYQAIEKVKDGCFFSNKFESNMVRTNVPHVIVFSNQEPEYGKMSEDRWEVKQLMGFA